MSKLEERPRTTTHEVLNQPPPFEGYNVFERDRTLVEAVRREGADWAEGEASELGAICGRADVIALGAQANENPPRLRTHDRFGNRIDEVEFHPAWHELMRVGIAHGLHSSPWREPRPGAHVARAAKFVLLSQVEAGVGCPISMTYSVIPAIRKQPELATEWEPRFSLALLRRRATRAHARQEGRAVRHGDDREAGRLRRSRQHHRRDAPERRRPRRRVRDHRPQVVLLGPDVRRVPRPGAGRGRPLVLPACRASPRTASATASTSSGSRTSSATARTPRARSSSAGAWARLVGEEGRGVPDDHRDGQPHPARLRDRGQRRVSAGERRWRSTTRPTGPPSESGWSSSR